VETIGGIVSARGIAGERAVTGRRVAGACRVTIKSYVLTANLNWVRRPREQQRPSLIQILLAVRFSRRLPAKS
jgi:hypothetical protein